LPVLRVEHSIFRTMKGEIKKETIDGKEFEIQKKGVTTSLEIQSIFTELIEKAGIPEDADTNKIGQLMMRGMRGELLQDLKKVIIECVHTPKLTPETYEDMPLDVIPQLFMRIYYLNVGEAEDKKKEQKAS